MEHDRMKQALEKLQIPPEDFRVLKLLPLIYVAWADGKIDETQKQRIHDFAMEHYELGPAGIAIMSRWLSERPTREYVAEGLHDIYLLARAEDDLEVDFSELAGLLSYAESIGRTTAKALGDPRGMSHAADAALHEIARELHVDHGESWGELLEELGGEA
ncbi:MAG TPA: hypothetical protein VHE30_14485 [Polyangiaceae bacterium]|nr:hypothetical protein [Polyangiaceae bacterium]